MTPMYGDARDDDVLPPFSDEPHEPDEAELCPPGISVCDGCEQCGNSGLDASACLSCGFSWCVCPDKDRDESEECPHGILFSEICIQCDECDGCEACEREQS